MGFIEEIEKISPFNEINGLTFTYYYDYDQLVNKNLTSLNDDQKIDWFKRRMYVVFLKPLSIVFDRNNPNHSMFRSEFNDTQQPSRNILIGAFSMLLNGIESCGSFMGITNNNDRFNVFIGTYLPNQWSQVIPPMGSDRFNEILWRKFRNPLAHGFHIENGGIEYLNSGKLFETKTINGKTILKIDPSVAFDQFHDSLDIFFNDINIPSSMVGKNFFTRFSEVYPT